MKLCECGCGEPTPIATRNRYERGQVKGEPLRFISGHNRNPPPPSGPGPLNGSWKGDDASYFGIHLWLRRHNTKTGVCLDCGKTGRTEWAFLRWPEPYTRDINDYRELCRRCHTRFDYAANPWNKTVPCPECGRLITGRGPLGQHMKTHA